MNTEWFFLTTQQQPFYSYFSLMAALAITLVNILRKEKACFPAPFISPYLIALEDTVSDCDLENCIRKRRPMSKPKNEQKLPGREPVQDSKPSLSCHGPSQDYRNLLLFLLSFPLHCLYLIETLLISASS